MAMCVTSITSNGHLGSAVQMVLHIASIMFSNGLLGGLIKMAKYITLNSLLETKALPVLMCITSLTSNNLTSETAIDRIPLHSKYDNGLSFPFCLLGPEPLLESPVLLVPLPTLHELYNSF